MPAEAINEALRLTTSQIYRNELEIDKKYTVLSGVLIEKKWILMQKISSVYYCYT